MNDALQEPSRAEVDALRGPAVIEFGSWSCGVCRAAQPAIEAARAAHPALRHIKVEDGRGRPLGRSFDVKLWPTLVFMFDGVVAARLVRPVGSAIGEAFANLARQSAGAASNDQTGSKG